MASFRNEHGSPSNTSGPEPRSHAADLESEGSSIRGLTGAIASSVAEVIRQNKLSTVLVLAALLVFIPLVGIRYDERPRYRQVIVPEVERLEALYHAAIDRSENGPTRTWQLYHFIDAHGRAGDVLDYLKTRKPVTGPGVQAHGDLILYYELVNEHFAILRTEMSLALELDFLSRWKEVERELEPIYHRWTDWVEG